MATLTREEKRKRRHLRVRQKIKGTPERPRVCITKSRRHLYVQVLDDVSSEKGSISLIQLTTNTQEFKKSGRKSFRNIEYAKILGKKTGELLKKKGITKIAFDRSGYIYHGIVKALADSIREQGIEF
ncbi:50S ribosomal protein L18 [Candidatus Sumerlaeota bacterium]|nr:50S ribosomal protein L18 [Candidatus Sumerlaeota bacterium]